MLDRSVLRLGGAAAMLGAVIGVVFNLLHPRPEDYTIASEIEMVRDSGIWLLDHWMLGWSIAFSFIGVLAVARSFRNEPAASWGRAAFAMAILGTAIAIVTVAVDGMALKEAADATAAGGDGARATAEAVAHLGVALFTTLIGVTFGLQPVVFGITTIVSDQYPKGLGYLAVVAGLLGIAAGSIQYLNGISALTATVLFLPASLGFTIYIFLMGWQLWKRTDVEGVAARPLA